MKPNPKEVLAGQAVYTPLTLLGYDFIVHGLSNRFLWKCPLARLTAHYHSHASANHLDIGVGTGLLPDRCRFPSMRPRVALMDLNPYALAHASARIARFAPETYRQNILEPIVQNIAPFDSVAMNYLLHCLPGGIREKSVVFDHILPVMNPGARMFGSTILDGRPADSTPARRLMAFYNRKGIFSNTADDRAGLEEALRRRFVEVRVETVGCVALFSGKVR